VGSRKKKKNAYFLMVGEVIMLLKFQALNGHLMDLTSQLSLMMNPFVSGILILVLRSLFLELTKLALMMSFGSPMTKSLLSVQMLT